MDNNEKILKKLYETGKREIRPMELIPLKFNFNGLFSRQSVALGIITYYFWKDVKYGQYFLERVNKTGQTEDDNPKYFIKKVEKDDDNPDDIDMKKLKDFLLNSEEGSYSTCKKYLKGDPEILLQWFQTNKQQGSDSISQWIAWTELSLQEIDSA